MAILATADILL